MLERSVKPALSGPSVTARYAVGIDLGTTNTIVAYASLHDDSLAQVFAIPQLVSRSEVEARSLLPSMLLAPASNEGVSDPFGDSPWTLGEFARRRGTETPGRLVASSKSWLAHPGVDRTAAILPWGAPEGAMKLSPLEAAVRLLSHVAHVWDASHPEAPLAHQEVVLTVPASFDEAARDLSVGAAERAGLAPKLLEEPQAAFYDWIARAGANGVDALLRGLAGDALVLVVDIGGGTTDLTLIRVRGASDIVRVAVGPHLLLGGDNMDLALANLCEPRLTASGTQLDAVQFAHLVAACRAAKETLLGASPPVQVPITVLGASAALVGGALTTRLSSREAESHVLDGFFPAVAADARPQRAGSALVAFGLPYERDAAITRHIASFLARHLSQADWPNAVLYNGGVFRCARIVERLSSILASWRGGPVLRLPNADPDLAVARGAVAYARARLGHGVRIGGGSARSYFVRVADEGGPRGVCILPRGAQEGAVHAAGRTFALSVGRSARFEVFASDEVDAAPGDTRDIGDERFTRLPPLVTLVPADAKREVTVAVEGELTPVGTVDLACVEVDAESPRRFRLAFQTRGEVPGAPIASPSVPSARMVRALNLVERTYGKARADATGREAKDLVRDLERALGERDQWTAEMNRTLFDALVPLARARRRSSDHERVFWLLAGWCIRPGFGDPLDAGRAGSLAQLFEEKLAFPNEARGWQQFFIAWRRAAGGLDEPMQVRLRDFTDALLMPETTARRKKAVLAPDDALDMATSLERVPPGRRVSLGDVVLERTWTERDPRLWVALGRLGARVPAYASVHHVVAPRAAERWLEHLLREKWDPAPVAISVAVRLARRTGDRARDIGDAVRHEVDQRLTAAGARPEQLQAVRDVVRQTENERAAFFADTLPLGLRLVD
jgi:molecular chaperone DnaK (HSP70)